MGMPLSLVADNKTVQWVTQCACYNVDAAKVSTPNPKGSCRRIL